MRHKLIFSAAEAVAFQNTAGLRDALLPGKSLPVVVAWLNPTRDFELCGDRVAEIHGRWRCKADVTVPYEPSVPYRVVEPVDLKSGVPRADDLRTAWLGNKPGSAGMKTRQSRPEETRFTAYVERISLVRVQNLTAEQVAQCGVRQTADGWSHSDSGTLFQAATLAFADHWNAQFPDMRWEENPWAWVLHLDEPVVHSSEKETLRLAERTLRKFQKNAVRLERVEQVVRQLRAEQRKEEQRVCRVLRTHCGDRQMGIGEYTAHLDMAFLRRNTRLAEVPVPQESQKERIV